MKRMAILMIMLGLVMAAHGPALAAGDDTGIVPGVAAGGVSEANSTAAKILDSCDDRKNCFGPNPESGLTDQTRRAQAEKLAADRRLAFCLANPDKCTDGVPQPATDQSR